MSENPRFYDAAMIRRTISPADCIEVVRTAMADFSASGADQPLRTIERVPGGGLLGVMPGWLETSPGFGAKIVTVFEDPARPGRARHRGVVLLFERPLGTLACIADADTITELRTAAASAVATDLMARPEATRLALLGCGLQAESHLHAISLVRPLAHVTVWGRSLAAARTFADRLSAETGLAIEPVADAAEAVADADIICTVTSSPVPILQGAWVRPGTHVNVVGSSHAGAVEVDTALVVASRYVADSRRSVLAAGAEFIAARAEGLIDDDHIVAEIGDVILGRVPGRTAPDQITLYKSLGHIVQDLAVAERLYRMDRAAPAAG